jgi:superfamily I DNA/RNA helicase
LLNGFQSITDHLLTQNFRNTREIFAFARQFVPRNPRPQRVDLADLPSGEYPVMYGGLQSDEQINSLIEIITLNQSSANIGVLVHFPNHVDTIRNALRSRAITHSYYYNRMNEEDKHATENNLQTPLITTFDSCKGLEFDIVIMPLFESADWSLANQKTTPNHYYVAATRARKQLFLFYDSKPTVLSNFESGSYRTNNSMDMFDF